MLFLLFMLSEALAAPAPGTSIRAGGWGRKCVRKHEKQEKHLHNKVFCILDVKKQEKHLQNKVFWCWSMKKARKAFTKLCFSRLIGCLGSSCGGFLFNSDSKLMRNALWAALAPPVVVPYSVLIQTDAKMLPGLPWLLLSGFLLNSYSKLMLLL